MMDDTIVSKALLTQIISQLESLATSQKALQEKIGSLAAALRVAVASASRPDMPFVASDGSYASLERAPSFPTLSGIAVLPNANLRQPELWQTLSEVPLAHLGSEALDDELVHKGMQGLNSNDRISPSQVPCFTFFNRHDISVASRSLVHCDDPDIAPDPAKSNFEGTLKMASFRDTCWIQAADTIRNHGPSDTTFAFGRTDGHGNCVQDIYTIPADPETIRLQVPVAPKNPAVGITVNWEARQPVVDRMQDLEKKISHNIQEESSENGQMIRSDEYAPDLPASSTNTSQRKGSLKAAPTRPRSRTTPRHQHHHYLDPLLRAKCPQGRLHALDVAIKFRDDHNADDLIPNNLLDELLEATDDDKYICFCCHKGKKARNVTLARDHVRKSLGNFPFQCPNSWCVHSSLRQADLNKHMKTCNNMPLK